MTKLTLHAVALIALTIGAVYSYEEVRFGERTASVFRVAFADESEARAGGGPPGFERRGRGGSGGMRRRTSTEDRESADATDIPARIEEIRGMRDEVGDSSTARMRELMREQSDEFRDRRGRSGRGGHGGHGGRGSTISLEEVAYYTIIFAFATMLTYTVDQLIKTWMRRRKSLAQRG